MDGPAKIVDRLKDSMFASTVVVEVDSIIVKSIFGQSAEKKEHRKHHMQTLAVNFDIDDKTRQLIFSVFEAGKEGLTLGKPDDYFKAVQKMGSMIYRECRAIKSHMNGQDVMEWCIAAYAMVINPESIVKLSCIRMGAEDTLGFAIHAKREIKKGTVIYELVGLMPKDGKAKHSEVSCIKPSSSQNQSSRVERVLFGPIRFVNHVCETPNVVYIALTGTSASYVQAIQDILPGQELLVDYGKGWFAAEPGGCPCKTCQPDLRPKKRQTAEKDEKTVAAEKAVAKKNKKQKQRDNKMRGFTDIAGEDT